MNNRTERNDACSIINCLITCEMSAPSSSTVSSTSSSVLDPALRQKYQNIWSDLRHYVSNRHFIPPKKGQIVETKVDTFLVKESAAPYAEYYL